MELLEKYQEIIIAGISLFTAITFYLKVLINKMKEAKELNNKELVIDELKVLIKEAETLFLNGKDKKKYCLSRMREFVKKQRIKISNKTIDEFLEELITLTNEVNINKEKTNNESSKND
ncbi:hypothetical protein LJC17_02660 [Acholeplasma sp. OttesenSCG-928-E16]|nr:hypothetical protein [Acholeplasma sp. OttesenSCG-928-E16]